MHGSYVICIPVVKGMSGKECCCQYRGRERRGEGGKGRKKRGGREGEERSKVREERRGKGRGRERWNKEGLTCREVPVPKSIRPGVLLSNWEKKIRMKPSAATTSDPIMKAR
jgi:hypothetical protein